MAHAQLKVRMQEPLRAALEEAARQKGRSMNAETVRRLEQSFEQDQRLEDVFGSSDLFGLMKVIASVMDTAGKSAGFMSGRDDPYGAARGWLDNPFAYDQALQAAVRVLDQLRPSGEIEAPDGRPPAGQPKATGYIDHQGRPMTEDEFYQRGRAYLQRLGTSTADQLLDQARGTRPKQAEKMRADLGRLAGRLDQEDDK